MPKLIIANWKLNPTTPALAEKLGRRVDHDPFYETVICPPSAFLTLRLYPSLGAQDCFWENAGPYTGQVSPATLRALKVRYCLVGHSERRKYGETDEQVSLKVQALLKARIKPVLCVGFGTTAGEDDLEVIDIVKKQVKFGLSGLSEMEMNKVIVAYEPVWAISSGDPYATKQVASPDHAVRVALFLKQKCGVAKVLYGGSVTAENAGDFLREQYLDGLLVGGASLLPKEFNRIVNLKI